MKLWGGSLWAALLAAVFGISTVACPAGEGDPYVPPEQARSELERADPTTVPAADRDELVRGNTAFSFDLLHALASGGSDVIYSPYSISSALAMTYAGARGDTATQMAQVLHFTLPQDRVPPAFNKLEDELLTAAAQAGSGYELYLANAIWAQTGFALEPDFLDTLALHYGAGVYLMDFDNDAAGAEAAINEWVSHNTNHKIPILIPPGMLSPEVMLVLTNAIYFHAAWKDPFSEELTRDEDFYLEGGGTAQVPMMRQVGDFRYALGDGVQALEMDYEGEKTSMVVVLPDPGRFADVVQSLDGSSFSGLVSALQTHYVHVELPRFEYDASYRLEETLPALGMTDAFDGGLSDFSGIATSPAALHIMAVVHKAFVDVNERGTEAGASTGVIMGADASAPPTPVEFIVDRPFLFLIRDRPTGTVLFLGVVEDPR